MSKPGRIIPANAYPQIAGKGETAHVARMLRSAATAVRGTRVIEENGEALRGAVLGMVADLESAGQDYERISDAAHDIRGLAETAGLVAAGRIADGLCRYFDEAEQLGIGPDAAIVTLHVSAIIRAARSSDGVSRTSDVVARELAALVNRKLTEIKALLR